MIGDEAELADIAGRVAARGFEFADSDRTRHLLERFGSLSDWDRFAASWDDLGPDTYMADGGRYRKRRYGVFAADARGLHRKPHEPHYQSRDYNRLNGGVERWFEPVLPETAEGPTLAAILTACRALFERLTPAPAWHIELHQFRIIARMDEPGRPTPEGMHRDGVDHVLVLMVARRNVRSGITTIHDLDGGLLGSFTLTEPLDAAIVDDSRVLHGVTPVEPIDPGAIAYRDVLVVTFRREDEGATPQAS